MQAVPASWAQEVVEVHSCRLHVDVRPGTTHAVVILHGQLGVKAALRNFGDATEPMTVAIPDLRGRGQSVCHDESTYTWQRLVRDVIAILDHLDAATAVLAGASMGAGLAIATALHRPERVKALVLWSSPYAGEALGWTPRQRGAMQRVLDMANGVRSRGREATTTRDHRPPGPNDAALHAKWHRHDPLSIATALVALGWRQPFVDLDELSGLQVPVAVAPGTDELHPAEIGERYLEAIDAGEHIGESPLELRRFLARLS
jgi:3-oxoadipate enol-lactonase